MLRHAKQLVVTSYHPRRKWVVVMVLVVAVPLGAWGLFDYGRYRAGFDSREAAKDLRALQGAVDDLQEGNDDLRQRLATNERAMEIDKQAYDDINSSLESMQNEISELKEEVAFYRGIAAPQDAAQGVRVQNMQIIANGGERGYSYKLVLVQTTKNASVAHGAIRLTVQGLLDQAQKEYSFGELSGQEDEGNKFRFRYFEKSEGDITLPADFIPTRVVVHVTVDSPKHAEVEAVYAWQDVIS